MYAVKCPASHCFPGIVPQPTSSSLPRTCGPERSTARMIWLCAIQLKRQNADLDGVCRERRLIGEGVTPPA